MKTHDTAVTTRDVAVTGESSTTILLHAGTPCVIIAAYEMGGIAGLPMCSVSVGDDIYEVDYDALALTGEALERDVRQSDRSLLLLVGAGVFLVALTLLRVLQ